VVSWVPQIVVPPLVALAFLRTLPRKWVVAMAPAIFLSDLDYIVPGEHRVWTHNLFVPLAVLGALALLRRRRAPTEPFWAFAARPGSPVALLLLAYYMAAHAVMDVFTGGVVLFWPLSNLNVYMDFELFLDTKNNTLVPQAEGGATPGPFPLDPLYPWVTAEHTAILAFLAAVGLVWLGVWLGRRWTRPHEPRKKS
jgi:MYXO-CTERM domain-containing protein